MTFTYTAMDFNGYASSPSASPSITISSNDVYFDSNSDSSNRNSPHVNQMTFGGSIPYEMSQYSAIHSNYYPAQTPTKIPVGFSSSALDEKDRRRKRSNASKSGAERETIPNMYLRRRAQNCASQRALRERKEKHVKYLEHQLEELHQKHQDLLQSYTKQADEASRLKGRISELSTELSAMRQCPDSTFSDLMISIKLDKFDALSSTDMIYNPRDTYL